MWARWAMVQPNLGANTRARHGVIEPMADYVGGIMPELVRDQVRDRCERQRV